MAQIKVINAIDMCAVEARDEPVQPTASLAICLVTENILDKGVFADRMQRAAMRTAEHLSLIKAFSNALLKNDNVDVAITTFAPNHVEKKSNRVGK